MSEKVKILLVDDSEVMRGFVADLLRKSGLMVVTAGSLVEGVDAYCRERPAAILMDFVLESGHTGLEALAAIFAVSSFGRPLAAILTQGDLAAADAQKAASLNVRILQKPARGLEDQFVTDIWKWLEALKA